jgi:hypothetical protein
MSDETVGPPESAEVYNSIRAAYFEGLHDECGEAWLETERVAAALRKAGWENRRLAFLAAPLPDDERPRGECGFNEPHEPHEYVVARDGRPVDLSCPGLPDDERPLDVERLAAHRLHVALIADGLGCDGTHSLGYATCQRLARLAAPQGGSERSGGHDAE